MLYRPRSAGASGYRSARAKKEKIKRAALRQEHRYKKGEATCFSFFILRPLTLALTSTYAITPSTTKQERRRLATLRASTHAQYEAQQGEHRALDMLMTFQLTHSAKRDVNPVFQPPRSLVSTHAQRKARRKSVHHAALIRVSTHAQREARRG